MRTTIILGLAVVSISLSGCASEVDKCVSEWEKANTGDDNKGDYCYDYQRNKETNSCRDNTGETKAQVRVSVRLECLKASKGE